MPPLQQQASAWDYRKVTDSDSLYVYNKTGATGEREAGRLVIPITVDGEYKNLLIENTHIPQDLSLQILAPQIARNSQFRMMVQRGIIEVINPETAADIMEQPGTKAEQKRLTEAASAQREGASHVDGGALHGGPATHRTTASGTVDGGTAAAAQAQRPGAAKVMMQAPDNSGNVRANMGLEIVDRLEKQEIDMETAVNSLNAVAALMSHDEKLELKRMPGLPVELREVVGAM